MLSKMTPMTSHTRLRLRSSAPKSIAQWQFIELQIFSSFSLSLPHFAENKTCPRFYLGQSMRQSYHNSGQVPRFECSVAGLKIISWFSNLVVLFIIMIFMTGRVAKYTNQFFHGNNYFSKRNFGVLVGGSKFI